MESHKKFQQFKNIKKKKEQLNFKRILKDNTYEFCHNTSLHAIKYVINEDLNIKEKCFFATSILLALIIAAYLIMDVYFKWASTPFLISTNPYPSYITDEPFPAVTLCNLNQALTTRVHQYQNNSAEKIMLDLLCNELSNFTVLETVSDQTNLENFVINVSQHCDEMLIECNYGAVDYNCSDIFRPIITDEGYCCAFNMLHPKFMYITYIPEILHKYLPKSTVIEAVNWNAETGYPKVLPQAYYPRRTAGSGESLGLTVTLNVQEDTYYCSSANGIGFKIALHGPNEAPNIIETGLLLEPGKEIKLRVKPLKRETETDLHSVPRKVRQCLFHDESRLRAYAHYSQNNCEKECTSSVLYEKCGCINHFMPKFHSNTTVCTIRKKICEYRLRKIIDASMQSCLDDCLPGCYDLDFNVDSFSTKIFYKNSYKALNLTKEYVENNLAVLHIFFQDNTYRSSKQTKFIDFTNFLSGIGGLLSLFLGFSFLSLVELFYYACVRPWKAYYHHHYYEHYPIMKVQNHKKLNKITPRYSNRWQFNRRLYNENVKAFQGKSDRHIFNVTSEFYVRSLKEYYIEPFIE